MDIKCSKYLEPRNNILIFVVAWLGLSSSRQALCRILAFLPFMEFSKQNFEAYEVANSNHDCQS
uniref:Uncharacterized protein n=1 Tax=Setaria italica TaxID=4555 RepID=K3YXH5_SETIT